MAIFVIAVVILGVVACAQAHGGEVLRIACVGDSITEGTVLADKANETWPARLQQTLGRSAVVSNFGRGGATCILAGDTPYTGSPQDAEAMAFAPDVVLIMLGTNDARSANAAKRGAFATDLAVMGHRFASLPSMPMVILCTPLPAFRANHTVDPLAIANDLAPAVRQVATAARWPLIDLNRSMSKLGPSCADGIHPDAAATATMATAIHAALKKAKLLSRLPPPSRLAAQLSAAKPQHLVVYGTSLTAGGAWVGQVQADISRRFPGLLTVTNSGEGGMWSTWGVEHLDERVIAKKPDTVLIEFGINDAYLEYATSVDQAEKNLATMVSRIRKALPQCEVVLMTMNQPTREHANKRPKFSDYMAMYRRFATSAKLPLIDLLPAWEALRSRDAQRWDAVVPDGIHPDAAGSQVIATPGILAALFERHLPH